ncbi:MAG: bifunctional (p)ppGpp synthetase/guanosine-3',5'-bis(diphosphate) 3'-pyrophosphohydrolase [Clostridia bacterium]|nr:bifunctional (p)ppGpp synthetase/guanosine-3',5'-bis(diphosphate) 3'-pyrophosphohydrolase [Clostridia bacterium]
MDEQCKILIEKIEKYNCSKEDCELVCKAYELAKDAHSEQFRKSGEPYLIHPLAVANILADLEMDCQSICAGLLHDVVEDTPHTLEEIKAMFGEDVMLLVEGVTKLEKIPFSSKEQQQIENLRKMFLAMAADIRVIMIKLADRLHNMRTLKSMPESKQLEKAKETLDVYAPLAHRLGISKIKWELEDISLRYLDPIAYREIMESIKQKRAEREKYIDDLIESIHQKLSVNYPEMSVHIAGRVKHFYSIFRKMYTQNKTVDEIYDLFAVRVIVNSITECYTVLGAVHEMYKPIPGRFKDYIAMPKPNMYQSLHTTVIGPGGVPFEIQIRTWEMHRTAEYGIAAHWKYKEGAPQVSDLDSKLEWIRKMLDVQNELSDNDSEEFMKTLKIDLFTDEVFVFTPKGDVYNLPVGSCPIDFAYAIHSEVGNKMVGAKVNGKISTIDQQLQTGDIVEILTTPTSRGPSLDWLKIVKTSQARNKINQWYKTHNRDLYIAKGKDIVDKEIRKTDIQNINEFKNLFAESAMKKFVIKNVDDMYASIGFEGAVSVKLLKKLKDDIKKALTDNTKEENETPRQRRIQPSSNGIIVKGIENCLVRLSRCCNPVPGDSIVGYITRGRGVSVHRTDCQNVVNSSENDRERMIGVEWDVTDGCSFIADLQISGINRNGVLLEITAELSNKKINICGVNARTSKENVCVISISIEIHNGMELNTVIKNLNKIPGVFDVRRMCQ